MNHPNLDDLRVNALIAQHLFNMEPWPDEPLLIKGKVIIHSSDPFATGLRYEEETTPLSPPDYCNDWSAFGTLVDKLKELRWQFSIWATTDGSVKSNPGYGATIYDSAPGATRLGPSMPRVLAQVVAHTLEWESLRVKPDPA